MSALQTGLGLIPKVDPNRIKEGETAKRKTARMQVLFAFALLSPNQRVVHFHELHQRYESRILLPTPMKR